MKPFADALIEQPRCGQTAEKTVIASLFLTTQIDPGSVKRPQPTSCAILTTRLTGLPSGIPASGPASTHCSEFEAVSAGPMVKRPIAKPSVAAIPDVMSPIITPKNERRSAEEETLAGASGASDRFVVLNSEFIARSRPSP